MTATRQNRLAGETSPYLLQHADNPVDWYPWCGEALQRARDEDKPILLSIGYSACHWCHVMAHESFEDEQTAAVMNELFINIKVDREERPDLDKIYQRAHQLLSQRPGGWPLTVFLMPDDHMPFFAGTYFPSTPRHQLPAFTDLLKRIASFYREHREELEQQNQSLQQALQSLQPQPSDEDLNPAPLDIARKQLENSMDWHKGGFGQAPKFPHPTNIERLLRHWAGAREDTRALEMAYINLRKMAEGGLQDQLGGGFCRYSVDNDWMIPHFEKMLYDNGPLMALYAQAWAATGEPLLREVCERLFYWLQTEMCSDDGCFYSSLDADSEGEEGKFYVWQRDDVRELLDDDEFAAFAMHYGLDREPNFEGRYYPHVFQSWEAMSVQLDTPVETLQQQVEKARRKLYQAREQRIRPGRDDKVLTSWNALMIRGLAIAGRHLQRPDMVQLGFAALDFIHETLWQDNRLLATYKDGKAHLNAYLDDYVFLIDAILELNQARWRDGDLDFAIQLADVVLDQFEDKQHGGFYFTASDHEQLIERPKPFGDESTPAGNGIAAFVFNRLGHLLGETKYTEAAERTLQAAWSSIQQIPYAHNALLQALEEILYPPQIVVIRGDGDFIGPWLQRCIRPYAPRRLSLAIPADAGDLPGLLAERKAPQQGVQAYICNGTQCQAPVDTIAAMQTELSGTEASASIKQEE